jgi:hypothetical protein
MMHELNQEVLNQILLISHTENVVKMVKNEQKLLLVDNS